MSIRIIALDLDGTLLDSGTQLSPGNRAALEAAAARGIHIVPSTGRFFDGMPQVVRELPFVRYAITINGAQVYDALEKTVLRSVLIPHARAEEVFDALERLPGIYDCYIGGWGYMDAALYAKIDEYITNPHSNAMVKALRTPVEDLRSVLRENRQAVEKIQIFFNDQEARRSAIKQLTEDFPDLSVTTSLPHNIEINDGDANKGAALRFLCRHLEVDIGETMAFGDGTNDRTMIEAAGLGVVMANGDETLRAIAGFVTDSNDADGVAKAIQKFCLL